MQERLINFQTAVLAKEKGFNQKYCDTGFTLQEEESHDYPVDLMNGLSIARPTISFLRRWIVDQNIHISVYPLTDEKQMFGWRINVYQIFPHKDIYRDNSNKYQPFENYDDAVEAGINEALKAIKI